MNLQFDIAYLRASHPLLAEVLTPFRHQLIDLSYVNFLHSDVRPERSLKTLGPILGAYVYGKTAKEGFTKMSELLAYNAEDTHNTVLALSVLATRIGRDYPDTDKLSPDCIAFYSDLIWCCILMTENGVPFHRPSLEALLATTINKRDRAAVLAESLFGLQLSGKGSNTSKADFLWEAIQEADRFHETRVLDDPRLELTPTTRVLSFNDANRLLIAGRLPPYHRLQRAFRLIDIHGSASKLIGSYLLPYLHERTNGKNRRASVLVPQPGAHPLPSTHPQSARHEVWLSHPNWFIVPSAFKDGAGDSGGTQQVRIVCKNGAHQTDPPVVQRCRRSRWDGGILDSRDASQIELRMAGVLSGEPSIIQEYFKPNPDIHTAMTVAIFGPTILDDPNFGCGDAAIDPRQWGKQANFLVLFRGGPDKFQATLLELCGVLIPLERCHLIVEGARRARPVLWAWQDSIIKEARTKGYLDLPFVGVSRSFLGGTEYDVNEIVNFRVQSLASLCVSDIQSRVQRATYRNPGIKVFLNVYDALKTDCRTPADRDQYLAALREAIAAPDNLWNRLCALTGHHVPLVFG